jgi:DNA-binding transcriptional MerR regulator
MKYLKIGEVASILAVGTQTLRDWDNRGEFVANRITRGGSRMYIDDDVYAKLDTMKGTPLMRFHNDVRVLVNAYDKLTSSDYYKEHICKDRNNGKK